MKVLKRYFRYLTTYFSNLLKYIISNRLRKNRGKNRKIIYFDIHSNVYRRHLANLIFWFADQGYCVYFKHRFKAIGSMQSFAKKIYGLPDFHLTFRKPVAPILTFTDRPGSEKEGAIYLNPDYFSTNGLNHIPLGMQPNMYFNGYYKMRNEVKNRNNRRIKIFFSGNMTEELYAKQVIDTNFGKLSRLGVYQTLVHQLPGSLVMPETEQDLYKDLQDKIVFNNRIKVMIPQDKFLGFLSECSFFLFTPGVIHPICHNNFEAMSVGTIPILQYPEYFYPALEHKKNCLVFKDEKDLISTIKMALAMPENEIEKMRKQVLKYYGTYCSVKSIVNNILEVNSKGTSEFFLGLD